MFDYQQAGIDFLVKHPHAFLGDDPGLGKTKQAIEAAVRLGIKDIVIVCPAIARRHWVQQIQQWAPDDLFAMAWESDFGAHCPGTVSVIGYSALSVPSQIHRAICVLDYELLIVDEAHYVKGISARAQAIFGGQGEDPRKLEPLVNKCERVWLLSGTPAPNNAGELYNAVSALHAEAIMITPPGRAPRPMSRIEFEDRYTVQKDTQWGRQVVMSKNIPELRQRLSKFILRRRKTEVLKQLPPLRFVHTAISAVGYVEDRPLLRADERFRNVIGHIPKNIAPEELLSLLRKHERQLASVRRYTGLLKAPVVADFANAMLLNGNVKLVIFAHHVAVAEALAAALMPWKPALITGKTSPREREASIRRFQDTHGTRVFIGQLQAAGTVITLTAASNVLFAEADWVPSVNYQAASRCHRIGQTDGVLAQMLYLPDSIDEEIARAAARKAEDLSALFD